MAITGGVTWLTIWAATRSAQAATAASLEHASALHRESLEANERAFQYQRRMSEAHVLRRAVTSYFAESRRSPDDAPSEKVEDLLRDADTYVAPSLTPGAPQLMRVVLFSLSVVPRGDDIDDDDAAEWELDLFEREESLLELIADWAHDPESVLKPIIERATRIGQIEMLEAALGEATSETRRDVVSGERPGSGPV